MGERLQNTSFRGVVLRLNAVLNGGMYRRQEIRRLAHQLLRFTHCTCLK